MTATTEFWTGFALGGATLILISAITMSALFLIAVRHAARESIAHPDPHTWTENDELARRLHDQ